MADARKIAGDDTLLARLVVTIEREAIEAALNPQIPTTAAITTEESN